MNYEQLLKYIKQHGKATFEPLEEEMPVRGNALASGDNALDKECEDKIIAKLNSGDMSAWFCACVKVTLYGHNEVGRSYLGACSYDSFAEFVSDNYYYPQLVSDAQDDLAMQLDSKYHALKSLELKLESESTDSNNIGD